MAKYRHADETKIVLDDLENRVIQLIEVNARYIDHNPELVQHQNQAFESVVTLIRQVRNTGHVMRGNDFVPDPIEPLALTKWRNKPQLGLSEFQQGRLA